MYMAEHAVWQDKSFFGCSLIRIFAMFSAKRTFLKYLILSRNRLQKAFLLVNKWLAISKRYENFFEMLI